MHAQEVYVPLINLAFFLECQGLETFRDWVLLNCAVCQELGQESGGLRAVVQDPSHRLVLSKLQ